MSSPSPPKPKKLNPYAGINSDPEILRAQQQLGIDKIKKDKHMVKINEQILKNRVEESRQDPLFVKAQADLGIASLDKQSEIDRVYSRMELNTYNDQTAAGNAQMSSMQADFAAQSAVQAQQMQDSQAAQLAAQQAMMAGQYDQMRADQLADAEAQRAFMEEMMNQPVFMPKQQAPPAVMRPAKQQEALLPAPAPNTPMSIDTPPAPELTNAGNKMAIVRTPKSTQARKRKATRGTSSLIN